MTATTERKRSISRADLWDDARYAAERKAVRQRMVELKRRRRCAVGPVCTFYFESWDTMWAQIQEMLHIEKGGEAQVADELAAYNPLVPQGRELVATVMFEIEDPQRRHALLSRLGGVEKTFYLEVGGKRSGAVAEEDVERTKSDGKTSSIHFLHFPLDDRQASAFKHPGARVVLGVEHPEYGHMAVMPEETRAALSADLD